MVLQGIEIEGHAVGRAHLVLPAVPFADATRVVVFHRKQTLDALVQPERLPGQLLGQGQHRHLHRSQAGVQRQHHALFAAHHLFPIGIGHEGQGQAVYPQCRLDDVGQILFAGLRVGISQFLAGVVLVLGQVEIAPVGDPPQFSPTEGKAVLDVGGGLAVVGKLLAAVIAHAEILGVHAQGQQPIHAEGLPMLEPLPALRGRAEEFQFHLLELAGTEDEVARRDFVAERFADLADAEGRFFAARGQHIPEVDEDSLGRFGPQVNRRGAVFRDPHVGFEHQVELTDRGPVAIAAIGTIDLAIVQKGLHLPLAHDRGGGGIIPFFLQVGLDELVRALTVLAGAAVDQGVGKATEMTGGFPRAWVHQDGRIEPHHIGPIVDEMLPPSLLDVGFQLDPHRPIIPGVGQAAVDL